MNLSTTRRTFGLTLALSLIALASGCVSKPDLHTDAEPGVDMRSFKTFAFYETQQGEYMSLIEKRLRAATRQQLERAHYVYDERAPDLRVNYALQVVEKQELKSTPTPGAFGYRSWSSTGVESVAYRQGTLVVDLVDTRRNALVWRAVAEGRLDAKALARPGEAIDAAIGELFARLPGTAP